MPITWTYWRCAAQWRIIPRGQSGNRPPRTRQPSPRPNQPAVTLDNCTPTGSRKRPRCPQMLLPPASRNALPAGRIRAWPRPLERSLPWRENPGVRHKLRSGEIRAGIMPMVHAVFRACVAGKTVRCLRPRTGDVLWRQGQRDQHREVTMSPCSGSKAAIVLRPATKKAAPAWRRWSGQAEGYAYRRRGNRKHVDGYNVVSGRSRPDQDCGGSSAARLDAASLKVWFAVSVPHRLLQHGERLHDLPTRFFIADHLPNQQCLDLGARKRLRVSPRCT